MNESKLVFSDAVCAKDLIAREEARYRAGIRKAVDLIIKRRARFVFLAGPSCSGKTTTSHSLVKNLTDRGLRTVTISTDDFFFNEEHAARFPDGTPDYDAFSHTDSAYIRRALDLLSKGESAVLPRFDFLHGRRSDETYALSPGDWDVFIVEGIHALNDRILSALDWEEKAVCLYLNTTAGVRAETEKTGFTPEEIRFCRRVIRDHKHRSADAERTFSLWTHVLRAEKEILQPFVKNAALVLSTDFAYEPAVARTETLERLREVPATSSWYAETQALLAKFASFPSWSKDLVPKDSVLQEFLAD